MGTDIFYEMTDNPESVRQLMAFCQQVGMNTAKMYLDAGVDVIAVVDPMKNYMEYSAEVSSALLEGPVPVDLNALVRELLEDLKEQIMPN